MKIFQFDPRARLVLYGVTGVVYLFIFAPILFVVYGSFDPNEVMSFPYQGFSVRWYREFFSSPMLYVAGLNTVIVAVAASALGTLLGGLAAYAVARTSLRGGGLFQALIGVPLVISKIVLGVGFLVLLVKIGIPRGLGSLVALHALLCLPFAFLVVLARLRTSGRDFEEAALTLGADDLKTAAEITVPLLAPALIGSLLLCLTVSFDEFSATQFVATPRTQTMPIQIYAMIQTGLSPTVNVFATVLTAATIAIPLVAQLAFGAFRRAFVQR